MEREICEEWQVTRPGMRGGTRPCVCGARTVACVLACVVGGRCLGVHGNASGLTRTVARDGWHAHRRRPMGGGRCPGTDGGTHSGILARAVGP
ncbi:hypothetical protein PVL29_018518 [Vitis rotundifolia]|uniref:Uncharacterized protein n=1 Tax=Vitis rotundifolia TaxID=103349 RepID=A0AA39DF38_VITRO|nr:hypothetical protein PVL29_018518 [Vitis rotundifolia]